MNSFFRIKELVSGYSNSFKLGPLDMELTKGSLSGIIGPNGSGKTTLFKSILGDIPIQSGSIRLQNQDISLLGNRQKAKKIAVVSQMIDTADLSVWDYVLMGRLPYRSYFQFFESDDDRAIAEKYMKLTDTYRLRNKMMNTLSGGEQQLASIARALTQEPEMLLLDEPTSHLDITHQVHVLNLIQKLNSELGLTVLMIIHDLNLASEYCDYLVMLKDGKIHAQGHPEEVINYRYIEEVYNTVVVTRTNPYSNKPVVFLISQKNLSPDDRN